MKKEVSQGFGTGSLDSVVYKSCLWGSGSTLQWVFIE